MKQKYSEILNKKYLALHPQSIAYCLTAYFVGASYTFLGLLLLLS